MAEMTIEKITKSLIEICSEMFRFQKTFKKVMLKLDVNDQAKYTGQYAWFSKRVSQAMDDTGLHIVNLEGQIYDPGMSVTPLNIDEFSVSDQLIIEQMIEPIIMQGDHLVKIGTVVLRRNEI